ncbi:unnamed protein product [Ambrosiozyma monospora]|uniref:Unnamed protein product n=1 Tax=Ambrosiozyma monospora TaxID=43982 RepID=A0ACB5TB18_AMBMO|nr:unnamed protein product [Ambrosiozyma monospora]
MFERIPKLKEQYGDLIDSPTLSEDDDDDDSEEDEEEEDYDDEKEVEDGEEPKQKDDEHEEDSEAEYYNAVEDLEDDDAKATGELLAPATTNPEDPDVDFVPVKDKFGLNDKFFSIDDYNKQVQALEDAGDGLDGDDEEEIDLFADLSDEDDDEDEEMYTYDDFFKKQVDPSTYKNAGISGPVSNDQRKKEKKVKFSKGEDLKEEDYDEAFNSAMADFMDDGEEDDEEEDEEDGEKGGKSTENLSTFEKQQRQIQMEIEQLEAESIAEKKWTMKGEASVNNRDADALLEEDLEFDRTAKPVPVITQEVTESIEEIIKRRIKDQQFDELKKRIVSELNDFKSSSKVEISETKSTKSLAEIYEDEYLDRESDTVNEELKKAHDEISVLFSGLINKLDSLTSAHFVPKPKQHLVDIKVQTSTIQLEDQTPLTMASNDTLAPQEVYRTNKKIGKNEVVLKSGVVMNKEELNRDDKQRLRRARKRKIHNKMKENAEKKQKVVVKQFSTA